MGSRSVKIVEYLRDRQLASRRKKYTIGIGREPVDGSRVPQR